MRVSKLKLSQIELELTDKDRAILSTMRELTFMRTDQVKRLFFNPDAGAVIPRAYATAATRALNRLKDKGLIMHLPRRVGGVKKGSQGNIWYLTEAGLRLLRLGTGSTRTKVNPPSSLFLRHTIAVSECYVQFVTICRSKAESEAMELIDIALEPSCWREYEKHGKRVSLRPDLFAITASGKYKDYWFIEIDLATESTQDIVNKCKRYWEYYEAGIEQRETGVFPVVMFIVPTSSRKQKLEEEIEVARRPAQPKLFLIILPDELEEVLIQGADEKNLR